MKTLLPKFWEGQTVDTFAGTRVICVDEVNVFCHCADPMSAFFCETGHLTECHYPNTCSPDVCAHARAQRDAERADDAYEKIIADAIAEADALTDRGRNDPEGDETS